MVASEQEVLDRYNERKDLDVFRFETGEYISFLPYRLVKELLNEDVTEKEWGTTKRELSEESLKEIMLEYMPFAWEKANNFRGISAFRSIMHYVAWLWMIGERELAEQIQDYQCYGKPQLVMICKKFGWDHTQWDDGVRKNSENE